MRFTFLFLFTLLLSVCNAQTIQLPVDNQGIISFIVNGQSESNKDDLFLASKYWVASSFKNYKDVIQLEDKDLGKITLNGSSGTDRTYNRYYIQYRIAIDCIDGKYRYILSDIKRVSTVKYEQSDFNEYYSKYLANYEAIKFLKNKLEFSKSKKEQKALAKQIFDMESTHLVLNKEISEVNKDLSNITGSYKGFMAKK